MIVLYLSSFILLLLLTITYLILKLKNINRPIINCILISLSVFIIFMELTAIYGYFSRNQSGPQWLNYTKEVYNRYTDTNNNVKERLSRENRLISNLAENTSFFPITANNNIEIMQNGDETFGLMFSDFNNAKSHIHIEDFIIRDDNIGKKFQDILILKAKQGVKVRLLIDGLGSRLKRPAFNNLRRSGVDVVITNRFLSSLFSGDLNHRDHRKIFIVDGKIAYTGGINVGDEYIGKDPKKGFWRDTNIRISGDSVKQLQSVFLSNWFMNAKHKIDNKELFPPTEVVNNTLAQVIDGNPNSSANSVKFMYTNLINSAQESIYISTPYIILDDELNHSISSALMKGIDVKIIIPKQPDAKIENLAYIGTLAFAEKLTRLKGKIYVYTKGYTHSKIMIIDNKIASVGTANLNNRSLNLDAENSVVIYDDVAVRQLVTDFFEDIKASKLYTEDDYKSKTLFYKTLEKIAIFFSPIQ